MIFFENNYELPTKIDAKSRIVDNWLMSFILHNIYNFCIRKCVQHEMLISVRAICVFSL